MRLLLSFFFVFQCSFLLAQDTSTIYNKLYLPDTLTSLGFSGVLSLTDGSTLTAGTYTTQNEFAHCLQKLDVEGEQVWLKTLRKGLGVHGTIGSSILLENSNGSLMMVGNFKEDNNSINRIIVLYKLDTLGTIIWEQHYGDEANEVIYCVQKTTDGGYILGGFRQYSGALPFMYVIKTDSMGNVEWEQVYGENLGAAIVFEITQHDDGGYLFSGVLDTEQGTQNDMYLVKTNSLGNMEWEKIYGTEYHEGGCKVKTLGNNEYILMGTKVETEVFNPYIAKLDGNGEIIWDNHIPLKGKTAANILIDSLGYIFPGLDYSDPSTIIPFISRLDSIGNVVWLKHIYVHYDEDEYIRDISPTPDGGYVMSGFNLDRNMGWVVKTDREGNTCYSLQCDSTTILIDSTDTMTHSSTLLSELADSKLSLYPNPSSGTLQIDWQRPSAYQATEWLLYNVQGQVIYQQKLNGIRSQLNLEHLPTGLYHYQIRSSKKGDLIQVGKLVLE